MLKLLNYRIVKSLLIGMLGSQIAASYSSLAVEPQSTINARSCASLGNSLTKSDIELRGTRLGFALDANTMGTAFENFGLDSLQYPKNAKFYYSPVREAVTLNSSEGVQRNIVPEAVGPVTVAEYDSSTLAITYIQGYPESFFTEVKFHRGPIYLSSFQHQIIGYVDVASRSRAGVAPSGLGVRRPTAGIEIVTPSDGTIALSVITTANEERVAIY